MCVHACSKPSHHVKGMACEIPEGCLPQNAFKLSTPNKQTKLALNGRVA